MAETTIEWTATRLPDGRVLPGYTFNPWTGCTKVSAACDHCYAESWAKRSGNVEWGPGKPRRHTTSEYWKQPARWNAKARALGARLKVFGGSLCDVFDAEVSDEWRDQYHLGIIERCPHLDFLLLTKRPKVAATYYAQRPVPPNVWIGVRSMTVATRKPSWEAPRG